MRQRMKLFENESCHLVQSACGCNRKMHADYVWCKSRLCGNVRAFEKVNPCPPLFVFSAAPTSLQDPAALPVLVKRRLHGDSKMGVLK
ncbi:hypothetical protein CC79DRAFT_14179 [Sarocladium strictum]